MNLDIPSGARFIMNELKRAGHDAYAVGGSVRDALLGRVPDDWDICTDATPDEVMKIFKDTGDVRFIPTGIRHGTVTVAVKDSDPYEVTTFRVDGEYKDGRRPKEVTFVKSLHDDLARRDFTINAMAYNDEEGLIDPFGGQKDLVAGRIRAVGDPEMRFSEDALRIMRGVRFCSQLWNDENPPMIVDEEVMYRALPLLDNIATERIRVEFDKLMCGDGAAEILRKYRKIIAAFVPEISAMFELDQENPFHMYDVWEHTLHAVDYVDTPDIGTIDAQASVKCEKLILRLAAFFHDIGKPDCKTVDKGWGHFYHHERVGSQKTNEIMRRLRYDNHTRETVVRMIEKHGIIFDPSGKQAARLLQRLGEYDVKLLIELERADVKAQHPDYIDERLENIARFEKKVDSVIKSRQCFAMRDLAISGYDLMEIGITEGRTIGRIKEGLLQRVIDGELKNEKEILIGEVSKKYLTKMV